MPEYSVAYVNWIEIDRKECELENLEKDIATLENLLPRNITEVDLRNKNLKAARENQKALVDEINRMKDSGHNAGETPEERRKRLIARVDTVKASGVKAFLKKVAAEEGFTISRLKQLIYHKSKPQIRQQAPFGLSDRQTPSSKRRV